MPLCFLIKIDEYLLELDVLASVGPARACHKWAKVMTVHADVILVNRWLLISAAWPHESLQGIESWLSGLLELIRVVVVCLDHIFFYFHYFILF